MAEQGCLPRTVRGHIRLRPACTQVPIRGLQQTYHGKAAVLQLLHCHLLAVHARRVKGELVDETGLQETSER